LKLEVFWCFSQSWKAKD